MFSKVISRAVFAVATFFAATAVHATPVSYTWTATADSNFRSLNIKGGSTISGTFTYDTADLKAGASSSNILGSSKEWTSALMKTSISFDTYNIPLLFGNITKTGTYSADVGLGATVTDSWWYGDSIEFSGSTAKYSSIGFDFTGYNVDSLSLASYDLTKFDGMLTIGGYNIGALTSFTKVVPPTTPTQPNPVPEPASLALFGLGLAGVAAMRRRKQ